MWGCPRPELWTESQLGKIFSTRNIVGPVFVLEAKIYGRDITYPLPPALTRAAGLVLKEVLEMVWGVIVVNLGSAPSVIATIEGVSTSAPPLAPCSYGECPDSSFQDHKKKKKG